jgi:hypothetical protein
MSDTDARASGEEQHPKIEFEVENETVEDAAQSIADFEDALNKLAEQTNAEYALVTLQPMTTDQHEANKALREHLEQRANE